MSTTDNNNIVWLVTYSHWDDASILHICSTEELANEKRTKILNKVTDEWTHYLNLEPESKTKERLRERIESFPHRYTVIKWEVETR